MTRVTRCLFALIVSLVFLPFVSAEDTERAPNIVLFLADDLGYECIGANGGTSYKTPVLDKLARTGARFTHCYSQPLCTPTRVQIMTGIYNVRNYEKFGVLPTHQITFANRLRDAGYQTCVVGKWQLGDDLSLPAKFGFDRYCLWHFMHRKERYPNPGFFIDGNKVEFKNGEYGPDVACDYACKFIEDNKDKPFLLYYPMILTHCPFCPTPDSDDWDPTSPGSKTYKGNAKYFGDMVTYMDKIVGRVVDKLDSLGIRENTLVMFVGDNGTDKPIVSMMGNTKVAGAKGAMTDGGNHVPLIASWPGTIKTGLVTNTLVDTTDFLPTICESAGVDIPIKPKIDGRSFLPQLKGETGTPREWVYVWYSRGGGPTGKQFTRNQRYKLYASGNFYDVENDSPESQPIKINSLTEEQRSAYKILKEALDGFANARPADVAAKGKKSK